MSTTPTAPDPQVQAADLAAAHERVTRSIRGMIPGSIALAGMVNAVAVLTVRGLGVDLGGLWGIAALAATATALTSPVAIMLSFIGRRKSVQELARTVASERQMAAEAARRELETRLANAFEMAEDETEALAATGRALERTLPGSYVEVLLADNSHAHLDQVVAAGHDAGVEGCCVASPDRCVAARRGQTVVFDDSDQIDACPKLADRGTGRLAAVCVPVSIMGRSVGVVHHPAPFPAGSLDEAAERLEVVANQLGGRLGMLRMMAESQLQAGTDGLTGLPNRRAFENRVRLLRRNETPFSLVMADLDEFKRINDTFGHGTGDRALRVFASVLAASLRPRDLSCRYGGEEFALVLPECEPVAAVEVCSRIREELAHSLRGGEAPAFTASFGIAASDPSLGTDHLVARADAALYRAKLAGRDRTVVHRPEDDPEPIMTGAF